jgi:hypothetical protein
MPILWDEYTYPRNQGLPKSYLEDEKWADEHMGELIEKYTNQWVAVVNQEVVCVGKNLAEVQRVARQKAGDRTPFCFFAWKTIWDLSETGVQAND